MFVDASAMIAILRGEALGHGLLETMQRANTRITSPIAFWEATIGLRRNKELTHEDARESLEAFLDYCRITVVELGSEIAMLAVSAHARYGKRYHPAALNMGDCFAYACAKVHRVPLLYVGNDFAQTDVNAGF